VLQRYVAAAWADGPLQHHFPVPGRLPICSMVHEAITAVGTLHLHRLPPLCLSMAPA